LPDDVAVAARAETGSLQPRRALMKILVTGFRPFGKHGVNPSEQIVETLRKEALARHYFQLYTAVLPTQYAASGAQIRRLIRRIRPAAVLCLGLAATRTTISLERVALNLDDDALPDTASRVRRGRRILRKGPAAYWSTLPLERMRASLEQRGIPASISNSAGAYVCNHVFYVARHEIETSGSGARCGFIHVPPLQRRAKAGAPAGMPLPRMVEAVRCCLEALRAPRPSADRP